MKKRYAVTGRVSVILTSADIPKFLVGVSEKGIVLYHIHQKDTLSVYAEVAHCDLNLLQSYADKKGVSVEIDVKKGLYWAILAYSKRPIFLGGCILVLLLSFWLPSKVLFVKVQGNTTIPEKRIIEQAQLCGISFGASRREVRSEKMKNSLLAAIPELQWAGINTYGCTAVISVTERTDEVIPETSWEVCNIVAARDGIIESCTATRGTAVCKNGQAVKEGELLISGYTDCGIKIQATRAEGEIFARTTREITVVVPTEYVYKKSKDTQERKFSLIIGKKQINFFKDSGIFDMSCVRMYKRYPVTLPGGFELPVAVVREDWVQSDISAATAEDAEKTASLFAEHYLQTLMISGNILKSDVAVTQHDGVLVLRGSYLCTEMIGRVRYEGITDFYGKNN